VLAGKRRGLLVGCMALAACGGPAQPSVQRQRVNTGSPAPAGLPLTAQGLRMSGAASDKLGGAIVSTCQSDSSLLVELRFPLVKAEDVVTLSVPALGASSATVQLRAHPATSSPGTAEARLDMVSAGVDVRWQSTEGELKVDSGRRSGSINAQLRPTNPALQSGPITLSGQWRCDP
jgi:hypothetical protein